MGLTIAPSMSFRALLTLGSLLALARAAVAAEWTFTAPAGIPSEIRNNSTFELFIPDTLPTNQPVRGLLAVFNYEGGAEMYLDARVRDWAARENLGILRHRIRNLDPQLNVAKTQGAVDILFDTALPELAGLSGRPEVAHSSVIWSGLSQAGWASVELANLAESRTIAALPIHESTGDRNPALGASLAGLTIPTLHVIGEDDNVNQGTLAENSLYAQTIIKFAKARRANGGLNAIAIQRNTGHTDWDGGTPSDMSFMLDWMSVVVDARVPSVIPTTAPYTLSTLDESSGFLGAMDLTFNQGSPFVSVNSASIEPYSPVGALDKWWLPNEAIGSAWRDYNATGTYAPVPEPSALLVMILPVAFLLRRRFRSPGHA